MAVIAPFSGLRYDLGRVGDPSRVLAPPYDVISDAQRLELEARHPQNVVRLELPRGDGDAKYANAAALVDAGIAEGILRRDPRPALYRYEQTFAPPAGRFPPGGGTVHVRRGFFTLVKLEPFANRVVLPHEHTLSAPKEDRRKLMRATRTHISQVFGLYRDPENLSEAALDAALGGSAPTAPLLDGTTVDGCRHRLWAVTEEGLGGGARGTLGVGPGGGGEPAGLAVKPHAALSWLGPPALRTLDVTVLHGMLLGPLLGIDASAMAKQSYLGYTHDTAEA